MAETQTASVAGLADLETKARTELSASGDEAALRQWHTRYFGPQGEMNKALKRVGTLPPAERKGYGQEANRVKERLTQAYEAAKEQAEEISLNAGLQRDVIDVTLPGRLAPTGRLHVATRVMREIAAAFADMGFQVFRSREVEDDFHNFEALNMPPHHPARDMWDTFHTTALGVLLRTHTSPGQIHAMKQLRPKPVRVILPGMCYRYEAITPRSEIMFQQVEGLAIGANVTMADLKGTLTAFARRLFGQERQIRIRSSYFPFTEPSIEVDVDCQGLGEEGWRLSKGTGWLEILGAGMVHPSVLKAGGYDPEKMSGFAFGMGPQRITMLKYAIDDIREFWKNDLRFLRQF